MSTAKIKCRPTSLIDHRSQRASFVPRNTTTTPRIKTMNHRSGENQPDCERRNCGKTNNKKCTEPGRIVRNIAPQQNKQNMADGFVYAQLIGHNDLIGGVAPEGSQHGGGPYGAEFRFDDMEDRPLFDAERQILRVGDVDDNDDCGSEAESTLLIPDQDSGEGEELLREVGGAEHCHVDRPPIDRKAIKQLTIVSGLCFGFMIAEIAGKKSINQLIIGQ